MTEANIQEHMTRNGQRSKRAREKIREIVMVSLGITKGDGAKEQAMKGSDLAAQRGSAPSPVRTF